MELVSVVLVVRDGLVLMGRRCGADGGGDWQFPGGSVERDEDPLAAGARELWEETGLRATALAPVNWALVEGGDGRLRLILFLSAEVGDAQPRVTEPGKCERWEWCDWSDPPQPLFRGARTLRELGWRP